MPVRRDPAERFHEKWIPEPNSGCWLWLGAVDLFGHGHLSIGGYPVRAHRFSFSLRFGEIPPGALVTHKCDVASCVNPDHLRLGTHATNMRDMAARGRGVKSKRGLPYGVHAHSDGLSLRFTASVRSGGAVRHLGSYKTIEAAAKAAMDGKRAFLASEPKREGGGR